MPIVKCKTCSKEFNAKPCHMKRGWGKYCSAKCHYLDMIKKIEVTCAVCGKKSFRVPSKISCSASQKFFCSKSCQTKWRNVQYSGDRHWNWQRKFSSYRHILDSSTVKKICALCKIAEPRVLAVHHIDLNRRNGDLNNLVWLCHNCHHLVHHDNMEQRKLMEILV